MREDYNPNRVWGLDKNMLVLKDRHPVFDPRKDYLETILVGVKLPSLPLEFWLYEGSKAIGNTIGKFLVVEDNLFHSSSCSITHISVEVDLRASLF